MSDKKHVLVVDDEPEVTFALQAFFLARGYEMLTALDGLEAMRILRERAINLVLLDMKMPGVNGLEVLRFIHTLEPRPKVVVVTAYDVQFQDMVEKIGVDAFLMKPFGIQALTSTVERVLEDRPAEPVAHRVAEAVAPAETEGTVTRGRILFAEPSEYTFKLKEVFFADPERCGGRYEVESAYSKEEILEKLDSFRPDILLVDLSFLGKTGDLTVEVMRSAHRPKEMILHGAGLSGSKPGGLGSFDQQGIKVVLNESFTRAGLSRLNEAIRAAALSVGLSEPNG